MDDYVQITTTVETDEQADALARRIVDARLAACVQCSPIRSTYRWKGAVACTAEVRLQAKTRAELADELAAFIALNHEYETPEVVVTPIAGGSRAYLDWIHAETRPAGPCAF